MREILFRGRNENSTWIYGSLLVDKDTFDKNAFIYYICDIDGYSMEIVNTKTIGQFTGLTDKNGTKIFEGDIVETKYGRWGQVVWFSSPRGQRWNLIPLEDKHKCPDDYDLWTPKNLEVIGNVHDNPELLNK